nr:EOG090X0BTB [Artemia franciscana]
MQDLEEIAANADFWDEDQGSSSKQSSSVEVTSVIDTVSTSGHQHQTSSIIVSSRQRGNPVLRSIRSVPWEYGDIVPDYLLGQTTCALYLSLRYHELKPTYIHERLKQLGKQFQLRTLQKQFISSILILLANVWSPIDVKDPYPSLKELTKICLLTDLTLMPAWSFEEAGQILETYKSYEFKPPDMIMEKLDSDPYSKASHAKSTKKNKKKTGAVTLRSKQTALEKICQASDSLECKCHTFLERTCRRSFYLFNHLFLSSRCV